MSHLRNQNAYALNATRPYPIDDAATGESTAGGKLPEDLIVDARLLFPRSLGEALAVSSVRVTRNVVSLTIVAMPNYPVGPGGTDLASPGFLPVATLSIAQPVRQGNPYPVSALEIGVGGWIVFGPGVGTDFAGSFPAANAAFFTPRASTPYPTPPVSSLGKFASANPLTGIVSLGAGTDIAITPEQVSIAGVGTRQAAVVSLSPSPARDVYSYYLGPCSGRPAGGTCDPPGIQSIGGVTPDCSGNLTITITGGATITPYASGGGMAVDYPFGASDACNSRGLPSSLGAIAGVPDNVGTGEDLFAGYYFDQSSEAGSITSLTVSSIMGTCATPFTAPFSTGSSAGFLSTLGTWETLFDETEGSSSVEVPSTRFYAARALATRNISLWDACSDATNKLVTVDARIPAVIGSSQNCQVVLNYRFQDGSPGSYTYLAVQLNLTSGLMQIVRWNGFGFDTIAQTAAFVIPSDTWMRIVTSVTAAGPGSETISVNLLTLPGEATMASLAVTTSLYGPADGQIGLGTQRSYADFETFMVEDT